MFKSLHSNKDARNEGLITHRPHLPPVLPAFMLQACEAIRQVMTLPARMCAQSFLIPMFGMALILNACSTNSPAPVTQKSGPVISRQKVPSLSKEHRQAAKTGQKPGGTIAQTREGLPGAVASPLTDLNLKTPVPPDFLENLGYIYTVNRGLNCKEIRRQIADLDVALIEPDTDILAAEEIARKSNSASETTLDVIGGIASSIIPLRPVVRTVTGARKAKKHYDERFDNGRRRRAFLKGYGLAKGCKPPAAPLITQAPYFGKEKPVDPNQPNKRWKDSFMPPGGK